MPQLTVRRDGARPGALMTAAALLVTAAALLPLFFIGTMTVQSGWDSIVTLVLRPRVGELLVNTALLVLLSVPLSALLGVALAWLTERSTLPGRRWWSALAAAPLAIPAFVQSYAWVSLWPAMNGLFAAVLLSVLAYFPFLYLPVAATLRRLDPALEEVAASLGHKPWAVFCRVVLPQLRLAIWGGGLLVGLHMLAEYGLYAMLRFDTFTTAIFDQFQSSYNGTAANMMGAVLALCCLFILTLEAATRGRARYARIGSGSVRLPALQPLGRTTALCLLLPVLVSVLALGVPLVTLARWLFAGGSTIWRHHEILSALWQTLALAGAGALLTTVAALPMAWLAVRRPGPFNRLLEGCNYVASALPGIIVALALVNIVVKVAPFAYQTAATVLLAYLLMFLPRALISLRAGLAQAPVALEEVARSLGRSPRRALWTVTMRLAAPGAAAGAAMVFLAVTNELTATLLLAPNGTQTLATAFWAYSSEIDYAAAAPYALLMIVLSLPLTWLLYHQSKGLAGR